MSKRISEAYIRRMELGQKRWAERRISPRLQLLDIIEDGAAKTFVYESPEDESPKKGFWGKVFKIPKKVIDKQGNTFCR